MTRIRANTAVIREASTTPPINLELNPWASLHVADRDRFSDGPIIKFVFS